jgi:ribosomal protein S18 acetylase RimI-like enzyme
MVDTTLTEQVVIRQIRREDLSALEWQGEYTHFRRLFADAFRRTLRGDAVMWVAELPEVSLVGQLFVQLNSARAEGANAGPKAYIYGFRVRPQYRNAGIGSLLLQTAEDDLARRGYRVVALNVGRDNPAARRLYERFGYRVVAAEPGVWSYLDHHGRLRQVNEPAWRMEKEIKPTED